MRQDQSYEVFLYLLQHTDQVCIVIVTYAGGS